MQLTLRIPKAVLDEAMGDLKRPHAFAYERVGFFRCRPTSDAGLVVVSGYDTVPDGDYVEDPGAGACIGATAIQSALQRILTHNTGQIHVHWHEHDGPTGPSKTDLRDQPRLVGSFGDFFEFKIWIMLRLAAKSRATNEQRTIWPNFIIKLSELLA